MKRIIRSIVSHMTADHVKVAEEAYLNASYDRIDLEYRQREIDRGKFKRAQHRGFGFD
jgi:hypothetical protein